VPWNTNEHVEQDLLICRLGEVLSFMPDRVVKQKRYNNTMLLRAESEVPPIVAKELQVDREIYTILQIVGF
jgi:hypothetical protein